MAAPPRKPPASAPALAPVPASGPALAPFVGSGPLVPSPMKPVPTPNLVDTPAPVPEETGVIPIPSVHGGLAAKVPSAAGRSAASWWSSIAAGVALGMTTCLHLHL
ncbi:hypothetical protein C2845_PM13G09460 [Panicum miliaceum]|uniref:Uncharacterized protein n=1 Tax=Panicum miliaceum TaxID=4540 RepID=A0A3L6RH08_PANMI|nr:hypothetical protein C2845_PM13G09460 [Panicum miliaceum]